MNELLKIILSLSLSGSLLILILLLCKPVIKHTLSKRWQYYIWLIVIARLLLPFAPETNLTNTLFQYFDSTAIHTIENRQTDQNHLTSSNYLESEQSPKPTPPIMTGQNTGMICLLVWLIVAIGLLIRKITIYQSFVTYMKAGRLEVSDLALWERMGKLVEQTGIKGGIALYTNSLIASPLLVGFFRPCIILPTVHLPDSDFEYTILHELTHCKRHDMFYKWLVQFTVCLHWFNPLVFLMSREINRACELACDEAVIRTLSTDERRAYGNTLLNAVKMGGSYRDSLASVTLSEGKKRLKERLDAIMNFKKKTQVTTAISMILALVLCFSATAAGAYAVPPQARQISTVINLASNGQGNIIQSGTFDSRENQVLVLTSLSNIQGGSVDFFLFSPDGVEQRFTFKGSDQIELATLSSGTWNYNCTGFFTSGDITISGELKSKDSELPEPHIPDAADEIAPSDAPVISLSSKGQGHITQSGSFDSRENQTLVLAVQSDIQGGSVDLILFSPDGKEQRFTFKDSDQTETVILSPGTWPYNCTGFFTSGDISITGELINNANTSN